MSIAKRVTYLKGLAEGLGLGKDTKEGKILHVMMDILDDIALELVELKEEIVALDDDLGTLSEGVEDIEDILSEEEEEEHHHTHGCCTLPYVPPSRAAVPQPVVHPPRQRPPAPVAAPAPAPVPVPAPAPEPAPEAKPVFYSVGCPSCSNEITIDDDVLGLGAIDCPSCGERLEFDMEDED